MTAPKVRDLFPAPAGEGALLRREIARVEAQRDAALERARDAERWERLLLAAAVVAGVVGFVVGWLMGRG